MNSGKEICPLGASFYDRPAKAVAVDLLGKEILRRYEALSVKAIIIDVEAYGPKEEDPAAAGKGMRALRDWPSGLAWTTYFMVGRPTLEITTKGPSSVLVRGIYLELPEGKYKTVRGPVNAASALNLSGYGPRMLNKVSLAGPALSIRQNPGIVVSEVESSHRINLLQDTEENRRFSVNLKDLQILRR